MIFAKNFARNYEKKILGTSDTWSMSRLSHRPSEPAFHIGHCRVLKGPEPAQIPGSFS